MLTPLITSLFCQVSTSFSCFFFFFFNDTATTEIYTLSLHDALPICHAPADDTSEQEPGSHRGSRPGLRWPAVRDRKSTRLNSSHLVISYAVFCLKKKKKEIPHPCSVNLAEISVLFFTRSVLCLVIEQ